MACDILYRGKNYSIGEFAQLLADVELQKKVSDGTIQGAAAKAFRDVADSQIGVSENVARPEREAEQAPAKEIAPALRDVESYEGMFNPKKTGISGLDALLEDDGYNYFYKGVSGKVVMMSPDEYLKKVREGLNTKQDANVTKDKKDAINEAINEGNKIYMPFISTKDGKFSQEGRNRAVVAKERGEKLIPVFIEKDISFDDKIAKGQEYIKSSIKDGAKTKEDVLSKLKKQGLHRDAIRFIDNNFDDKAVESILSKEQVSSKPQFSVGEGVNMDAIEYILDTMQIADIDIESIYDTLVADDLQEIADQIPKLYRYIINNKENLNLATSIKNALSNEEQIRLFEKSDKYIRNEQQEPGQDSDSSRQDAVRRVGREGNAGARVKYRRPPLLYANDASTTPIYGEPAVAPGQYNIDTHQEYGVNLALQRFSNDAPNKGAGFLLGDGAGVGKTRQMIVIANEYAKRYGKKILILTLNDKVIENFKDDAKALNIDINQFELKTHSAVTSNKLSSNKYDLVIIDEAHSYKNIASQRAQELSKIQRKHTLYASATPMDKPHHAAYFMSELVGKDINEISKQLGFNIVKISQINERGETEEVAELELLDGVSYTDIVSNIVKLRNDVILNGAMVRRYYPFAGTITSDVMSNQSAEAQTLEIQLDEEKSRRISAIRRSSKLGEQQKKVMMIAVAQKFNSYKNAVSEWSKAKVSLMLLKDALNNGRKVVVMAERISATTLDAQTKTPKPVSELPEWHGKVLVPSYDIIKKYLDDNNIRYGILNANATKSEQNEYVRNFQEGKIDVILATPQSGGTGINLDDTAGDMPRTLISLTTPYSGSTFEQMVGRVSRRNTASPAEVRLVFNNDLTIDRRRQEIVYAKMSVLRAINEGEDVDVASLTHIGKFFESNAHANDRLPRVVKSEDGKMFHAYNTYPFKDAIKKLQRERPEYDIRYNGATKSWDGRAEGLAEIASIIGQAKDDMPKMSIGHVQSMNAIGAFIEEQDAKIEEAKQADKLKNDDIAYDVEQPNTISINGQETRVMSLYAGQKAYKPSFKGSTLSTSIVKPKNQQLFNTNASTKLFAAKHKIEGADDVAYIFQALQSKTVEHAYAVHVDDKGKFVVQLLNIGTYSQVNVDIQAIVQGCKQYNTKKLYFVHNHPSGNVMCSEQDQKLFASIRNAIPKSTYLQDGIIMNVMDGKYGQFNENTKSDSKYIEYDSEGKEHIYENAIPIQTQTFNPLLLQQIPTTKITNSIDTATFIHNMRLGSGYKSVMLVLNNNGDVLGTYYLPEFGGQYPRDVTNKIIDNAVKATGAAKVIIATDLMQSNFKDTASARQYVGEIATMLSGTGISIEDVVHVKAENTDAITGSILSQELNSAFYSAWVSAPDYIDMLRDIYLSMRNGNSLKNSIETAANAIHARYLSLGATLTVQDKKDLIDHLNNEFNAEAQAMRNNLSNYVQSNLQSLEMTAFGNVTATLISENMRADNNRRKNWVRNIYRLLAVEWQDKFNDVSIKKMSDAISRIIEYGMTAQIPGEGTTNLKEKTLLSIGATVRLASLFMHRMFELGVHKERRTMAERMKGSVDMYAMSAKYYAEAVYKLVGNDPVALERIDRYMDPDFYTTFGQTVPDFAALTPQEQAAVGLLEIANQAIHDLNFVNGFIAYDTYIKMQGRYMGRFFNYDSKRESEKAKFFNQIDDSIYGKRKELSEYTIDDYNNKIKDPVAVTMQRIFATYRNHAIMDYLNNLKATNPNVFTTDVNKIGKGYVELNGNYAGYRGAIVLRQVAEDITGYIAATKVLDAAYKFTKAYDNLKVRQLYKQLATVYNPGIHVGNIMGNMVFSTAMGIDPASMLYRASDAVVRFSQGIQGDPTYRLLIKEGVIGTSVRPKDKEAVSKATMPTDEKGIYSMTVGKVAEFYYTTDDLFKYAAYQAMIDMGTSPEKAIENIKTFFQNNGRVSFAFDFASKMPLVNMFIKWKYNLGRIIKNTLLQRPLQAAGMIGTYIYLQNLMQEMLPKPEPDDDKERRQRAFGKPFLPNPLKLIPNYVLNYISDDVEKWKDKYGNISLTLMSYDKNYGLVEYNVARLLSPFYMYTGKDEDIAEGIVKLYVPITPTDVSTKFIAQASDPVANYAGAAYTLIKYLATGDATPLIDMDYRGITITDPNKRPWRESTLTQDEQNYNIMKYYVRTLSPTLINASADLRSAYLGEPDYYNRFKTPTQAVLQLIFGVKAQVITEDKYQQYLDNEVGSLAYEFKKKATTLGETINQLNEVVGDAQKVKNKEQRVYELVREMSVLSKNIEIKAMSASRVLSPDIVEEIGSMVGVSKKVQSTVPYVLSSIDGMTTDTANYLQYDMLRAKKLFTKKR